MRTRGTSSANDAQGKNPHEQGFRVRVGSEFAFQVPDLVQNASDHPAKNVQSPATVGLPVTELPKQLVKVTNEPDQQKTNPASPQYPIISNPGPEADRSEGDVEPGWARHAIDSPAPPPRLAAGAVEPAMTCRVPATTVDVKVDL
jgi:hypothetical protein